MNKKIIWGIIIIVIVLLGLWLFTQDWWGNGPVDPIGGGEAEAKTYTNEKYGFEFKYPANWNILTGDENSDLIQFSNQNTPSGDGGVPLGAQIEVMYLKNYDSLSLADWVEQINSNGPEKEIISEEEIEVAGKEGIRQIEATREDGLVEEGNPVSVYFARDDYIYVINYLGREPDYSDNLKYLDYILNTFKLNN